MPERSLFVTPTPCRLLPPPPLERFGPSVPGALLKLQDTPLETGPFVGEEAGGRRAGVVARPRATVPGALSVKLLLKIGSQRGPQDEHVLAFPGHLPVL